MVVGNHKEVTHYDGAYWCSGCLYSWGALPKASKEAPPLCFSLSAKYRKYKVELLTLARDKITDALDKAKQVEYKR
jgi:hypothetical protein